MVETRVMNLDCYKKENMTSMIKVVTCNSQSLETGIRIHCFGTRVWIEVHITWEIVAVEFSGLHACVCLSTALPLRSQLDHCIISRVLESTHHP